MNSVVLFCAINAALWLTLLVFVRLARPFVRAQQHAEQHPRCKISEPHEHDSEGLARFPLGDRERK